MNIKYIYHLPVVALLLLTACSSDLSTEQTPSASTPDGGEDLVAVTFTVGEKVEFTRAATNIVTFDNNEDIKVFVKPNGADGYTGYTYKTALADVNVPQQTNVSLTAPDTPPYFPVGASTTVQAYAYYPATAVSGQTFSVLDNQTSNASYKASDLMFAANRTITKGSADGTNLQMAHLMAQLHLNITGSGLTVNRVLVNAKRNASFSVNSSGVPTVSATGSASDIVAATGSGDAYVCIPVQPINTVQVKVVASGDGDEASRTATFTFTSESEFEAGKSYPINLTVSSAQLGVTTAIVDWNGQQSVTINPTGDLTIDPIVDQTYSGSAKTPTLTVKKGNTTLTKDAANGYTCQWFSNTNAGTGIVVVLGQGTYAGSVAVAKFTINKAAGSISYASATETKTYGNTAFTKTLTITGDGTVTYSCSPAGVATVNESTGAVTITGAGSTTITATVADGSNYTYASSTASYTLTVNPAALTLTADNKSKTYGAANPALTYTASGFVNGETTSVLTTQPTLSTTANASSAVGQYPITISGAAAANYTISYVNGTLTVISPYTSVSSATASHVGKIICSNGHIHNTVSAVDCGGTAVAMIVYVGTAGTADASSNTYKGLAIALTDASDGAAWYGTSSSYSADCLTSNPNSRSSTFTDYWNSLSSSYGKLEGIQNTERLTGKKVGNTSTSSGTHCGHAHDAANAALNYSEAAPAGTSGWFLPSGGQWLKFFGNAGLPMNYWTAWGYCPDSSGSTSNRGPNFTAVNNMFTNAGATGAVFSSGSTYWSSSEYSDSHAVRVSFYSSDGVRVDNYYKYLTRRVRAFLAF